MHTHDFFAGHLSRDREAQARRRANGHRLRVAAGVDGHSRIVAAAGDGADRLRAGRLVTRDRAAAHPVCVGADGSVGAVV